MIQTLDGEPVPSDVLPAFLRSLIQKEQVLRPAGYGRINVWTTDCYGLPLTAHYCQADVHDTVSAARSIHSAAWRRYV